MSFIQNLINAILPKTWVDEMRTESETWMVRCTCGFERSVWDCGGVRWKARGKPRQFRACPACSRRTWHTVYRKTDRI